MFQREIQKEFGNILVSTRTSTRKFPTPSLHHFKLDLKSYLPSWDTWLGAKNIANLTIYWNWFGWYYTGLIFKNLFARARFPERVKLNQLSFICDFINQSYIYYGAPYTCIYEGCICVYVCICAFVCLYVCVSSFLFIFTCIHRYTRTYIFWLLSPFASLYVLNYCPLLLLLPPGVAVLR